MEAEKAKRNWGPGPEICYHMAHSYNAILLTDDARRATQIAGLVTAIFSNYARTTDDGRRAVRLLVSASVRAVRVGRATNMDLQFSESSYHALMA